MRSSYNFKKGFSSAVKQKYRQTFFNHNISENNKHISKIREIIKSEENYSYDQLEDLFSREPFQGISGEALKTCVEDAITARNYRMSVKKGEVISRRSTLHEKLTIERFTSYMPSLPSSDDKGEILRENLVARSTLTGSNLVSLRRKEQGG